LQAQNKLNNSDAYKSIEQLASENGFFVSKYQVITDDGYILGLWRINGNLNNLSSQPPVLLQHGLGSDMMQWVMNKADSAPAFILA
jgi:hypothetical protein